MNVNLMGVAILWWFAHKPEMFEQAPDTQFFLKLVDERKRERDRDATTKKKRRLACSPSTSSLCSGQGQ